MRCDASNGYAGWTVREQVIGCAYEDVLWVDPDVNEFCTIDRPIRLIGGLEVATTVHRAQEIIVDLSGTTFWIVKAPVFVAPLSSGRQQEQEPTGQACADCCQEETCRRVNYCAAHRGPFGERAP